MDATQAAEKWGCSASTVREYCRSGLIPPAEKSIKFPFKWDIPDEWEKPPLTRVGLCELIEKIEQIKEGVKFESIKWGYSIEKIREGYAYLIGYGFISTFDLDKMESELDNVSLTKRGKELLERKVQESHQKAKETHINAEMNLGVVRVGVDHKSK